MRFFSLTSTLIIIALSIPYILEAQAVVNNTISGVYKYENYEKVANGCCQEKWTLSLHTDTTFHIEEFHNEGCYTYIKETTGKYILHKDTLSLLCHQQHEIEVMNSFVEDSLFQISFPLSTYDLEQIKYILENQIFFTANNKGKRRKVDWLATHPSYDELSEFHTQKQLADTVSFVFKQADIEDYLICGFNFRGLEQRSESQNDKMAIVTLAMDSLKSNNYLVHTESLDVPYPGSNNFRSFKDYSLYQFLLDRDTLTTNLKYWTLGKGLINKKFVKDGN